MNITSADGHTCAVVTTTTSTLSGVRPNSATQQVQSFLRKPAELLAMEFDPSDQYLENGVLCRGRSLVLLGPAGLGKSRLLSQLAVCTIVGRDFLGMPVRAKNLRWLILQTENGDRRLQRDLQALKGWIGEKDWGLVEESLAFPSLDGALGNDPNLKDPATLRKLETMVQEYEPDVIAVDPLAAFAVGSLNADEGMRSTCRALTKLAAAAGRPASLVVLHHTLTGKDGIAKATGLDRGSYGRGSKALNGWARAQVNLAPGSAESNGTVVVACGKLSDFPEFQPIGARLNPETRVYEVDPDFDLENWKNGMEPKDDVSPSRLERVAEIVREAPLSRVDLCARIQDAFLCGKSTAYYLIGKAEGVTVRRNSNRRFEAVVSTKPQTASATST